MSRPGTHPSIPDKLYFRIGDVADIVGVKPYVLRYWETEFSSISPEKSATGQRVYRKSDVEMLLLIKHLLYTERYSIEGARNRIRELKREGGLKKAVASKVVSAEANPEDLKEREQRRRQLHSLGKELRSLASTPIRELFRY